MKTITQVSEELGIVRSSVWYHVRKMGLGTMTGSVMLLSAEEVERIRRRTFSGQRERGMVTATELMDELGLSREIISRRIRKLGIATDERRATFLTREQADQIRGMD